MTNTPASDSTYVKGLAGVVAAQTAKSSVDGVNGVLTYCGINIHELAEQATFEEVAYLLLYGRLPNAAELSEFSRRLVAARKAPKFAIDLLRAFPRKAVPMDVLRTVISALSFADPDTGDISEPATLRKGLRLTAQFPTLVAAYHRIRKGKEPVAPKARLGHTANFLYMLTGREPDDLTARALDMYFVLLADHSLNASTFTSRVVASTQADLHAAVTAGLSALKGPLHGGAAEATMHMLLEIGEPENVDKFIENAFATKRKVMGIGHRIYKTGDPRVQHLQAWARKLGERAGEVKWVDVLNMVGQAVMRHKQLYPNVDFFSSALLYYIGIPIDLDTCVFACARIVGWTAHVIEQYHDDALIRPKAEYTGARDERYVPLDQRN